MNSSRLTIDTGRVAPIQAPATEVLPPSQERAMIRELAECKRKLSDALAGIGGIDDAPQAADSRAVAQFIANRYSESGPDQARLGAIYRRYSELRWTLALANIRLVAHLAKRFRDRGIPVSDLMQEGFCGLLEAIDRFDLAHRTKLATYATWWIRQSMQRAVASGAYPVRLTPRHLRQLAQNQRIGRSSSGANLVPAAAAPEVAINVEMISRIHTATQPAVSLNAAIGPASRFCLVEAVSDPAADHTHDVDMGETVEKLLEVLRPREQRVLSLRYGLRGQERLSLTQVGKLLAVSKERVRQIEERAIKKLRASVQERHGGASPQVLTH